MNENVQNLFYSLNDMKTFLKDNLSSSEIMIICGELFNINYQLQKYYFQSKDCLEDFFFYAENAQIYAKKALELSCGKKIWEETIKFDSQDSFFLYYSGLLNCNYTEKLKKLSKIVDKTADHIRAMIHFRICECFLEHGSELVACGSISSIGSLREKFYESFSNAIIEVKKENDIEFISILFNLRERFLALPILYLQ